MDTILEGLKLGFIQRALLSGTFIAVSCASLGVFLVLKRLSLIGEGLSHFTFGTIGLGLLLNVYPFYVAAPLAVLASFWILHLAEHANVYSDAAIGLISAIGIALGILLASKAGGFNVDLFSYLFGDILAVSKVETVFAVVLSLMVMITIIFFFNELFAITFDEDFARVQGIKTRRMDRLLVLLTAMTVILGIKVVGTMLVASLIIFPSISALQIAKGFSQALVIAVLIAIGSVLFGILLAFLLDFPAGATIVMINFAFFLLMTLIKTFKA